MTIESKSTMPTKSTRSRSRRPSLPLAAVALVASSLAGRAALAQTSTQAPPTIAATAEPTPFTFRPSIMAGLTQWAMWGGGNLAAQLKTGRLVFEYSHGQSLHFERLDGLALTSDERSAGVAVGMPWTTGGGIGFQITPHLHILLEVKAHKYDVRDPVGQSLGYTSLTVGPGVFYDIYLWRGLFLQPNVRWWPTVASTFETRVLTGKDGAPYTPKRHDLAPFVNVNVGWTFDGV